MLCRVCKLQTSRRIIGQTVREVCKNPKCRLHGVPQGEPLIIPQEVAQEVAQEEKTTDETATMA